MLDCKAKSSELMEAFNSYNTLYQQGRYSEAEPYAKEALRLGTEEFGPNDPFTASLFSYLAALYYAQGHYAEAEPLYQRALACTISRTMRCRRSNSALTAARALSMGSVTARKRARSATSSRTRAAKRPRLALPTFTPSNVRAQIAANGPHYSC